MSAEQQIEVVANYIMAHVPGEPSRSEGAGDCAVRLLTTYRAALVQIMRELGVPNAGYPSSVANAYEIAWLTLGGEGVELLAAEAEQVRGIRELLREQVDKAEEQPST